MEVGERPFTGLDLIRDTSENVDLIRKHLFMATSSHGSDPDEGLR